MNNVDGWNEVWNAPVIPKFKHFLWRIFSNSLPTITELFRRHISDSGLCPLYRMEDETVIHAFFYCHHVRPLWSRMEEAYGIKSYGFFGMV